MKHKIIQFLKKAFSLKHKQSTTKVTKTSIEEIVKFLLEQKIAEKLAETENLAMINKSLKTENESAKRILDTLEGTKTQEKNMMEGEKHGKNNLDFSFIK